MQRGTVVNDMASSSLIDDDRPFERYDESELGSKQTIWQRHRTEVLIFGVLMIATISLAAAYWANKSDSHSSSGLLWGFDDAFDSSNSPRYAALNWIQDKDAYAATENGNIVLYYPPDLNNPVVLAIGSEIKDPNTGNALNYDGYRIAPGEKHILFSSQTQGVYRYSTLSIYLYFDVENKQTFYLADGQRLQAVQWSNDGQKLAYVMKNNVYIYDLLSNTTATVTTDGAENSIINGICDWTSEEEIFGTSGVLYWSPDSSKLAFLRFDESAVPTYQFPVYESPYNEEYIYKYSKSGVDPSFVSALIYEYDTQLTVPVALEVTDNTTYITALTFFTSQTLVIRTANRLQNTAILWSVDAVSGAATQLFVETHPQYLEPQPAPLYFPNLNQYVDLIVVNDGLQLALFEADTGTRRALLTSGPSWGVVSVVAANYDKNLVYFLSNKRSSLELTLYGLSLTSSPVTLVQLVDLPSQTYTYQSASFSSSCAFFLLNEASMAPRSELYQLDQSGLIASSLKVLQDNSALFTKLEGYNLPRQTFQSVPGNHSATLNSFSYLPPDFDSSCDTKYPVLIYAYGGPGAQEVTRRYPYSSGRNGWHLYLSSIYKFIIFEVDPTGTGGRGDSFMKSTTYKKLGLAEADDVLTSVRSYLNKQCYVDQEKIAFWGWSYGGFLSSVLASHPDAKNLLHSNIAVAPVVDWRLYDNVYTERYMQTPSTNSGGYNSTSVVQRVQQNPQDFLSNYLLVHGTSDDNVHFQNGALLAEALQQLDIQYETMVYTNRAHGLRGPNGEQNLHLYHFLANYLVRTLNVTVDSGSDDE